jgi:hypothetical protein
MKNKKFNIHCNKKIAQIILIHNNSYKRKLINRLKDNRKEINNLINRKKGPVETLYPKKKYQK